MNPLSTVLMLCALFAPVTRAQIEYTASSDEATADGGQNTIAAVGGGVAAPMPVAALTPVAAAANIIKKKPGFFQRFALNYWNDWHPAPDNTPPPKFRGFPAPVEGPPYPFSVWPYGGSVVIGYPWTQSSPLMQTIWDGKYGDAWKRSGVQMYGWIDVGGNSSSSTTAVGGKYANSPAAYSLMPNGLDMNQMAFYIERQPDTVQTDHFDWGFRFTSLYGTDYRFTTGKGYFSQQLLNNNKVDGTTGNAYGWDPVMMYLDLYFPHVAEGMDLRIGRYVSLPDIEAQLAPNNYTYTHSLLYTYDCYTQTGANASIKLSERWLLQMGLSAGCDAAPWTKDARATANLCLAYTWQDGGDNIYVCANSINNSQYAYNNLAAYYVTWFHKINRRWHTGTEAWYQYEKGVPNVNNPSATSMIETNASGAVCATVQQLTCYAPDWSMLNYTNVQLDKHNFISIRNEYFDDIKGQRTGFKTKYTEDGISWNHWVGNSVLIRPELRFERSYQAMAYDGGHRHNQLMFAADMMWFF